MHHTSQLFATNPYSVTMLPVYTRSHLLDRDLDEKWRTSLRHNRSVTVLRLHAMNSVYLYTSRAL